MGRRLHLLEAGHLVPQAGKRQQGQQHLHLPERLAQGGDGRRLRREGRKPKAVIKETQLGYFSFSSNLDLTAKEIYLSYNERWDIEQCFDFLKNSVSASASHAHNDDCFRGWTFLNHISLLYYYGLRNALRNAKLDGKYSAKDVIKLTKNIYCVDTGDGQGFKVSAIQKTQEILTALGAGLLRNN